MGVFENILADGISRGHIPERTQSARDWYRDAAKNFAARLRGEEQKRVDYGRNLDRRMIREYNTSARAKKEVKPGHMYMYAYDAKHKDTLPYWDRFPLIFPFRVQKGRFWGINLHYLPLPLRAKLMDALYDITNNKRFDESTRLVMSYKTLNASSKFSVFKPCIKQYLTGHVRSNFMEVNADEWSVALFLPLEKFVGKSKTQVWADSKKKLGITKK